MMKGKTVVVTGAVRGIGQAIAALCADGGAEIANAECVSISYPRFYEDLNSLCS